MTSLCGKCVDLYKIFVILNRYIMQWGKTSTSAIGIDNEHVSANDYKREREREVGIGKKHVSSYK